MTNKTITESGFREFLAAYDECDDVHEPSLREAFKKIGFPIEPDPVPEPRSGELVVDCFGVVWNRDTLSGRWECLTESNMDRPWGELQIDYGPLSVYAEVDK